MRYFLGASADICYKSRACSERDVKLFTAEQIITCIDTVNWVPQKGGLLGCHGSLTRH